MKNLFFSAVALIIFTTIAFAQPAPATVPSADEIMKEAYALAAKEHKNVLIMFHASWCGWCHRMDNSINDPSVKKLFEDNYVIRHLVVDEIEVRKNLENAGASDMRDKYNGKGQGIPFWLIFDKKGNLLSDSKIRKAGEGPEGGSNCGCPAAQEEVAFFISVLKKTSKLKEEDLAIISTRFRKNEH